jgi:hypothetical protein
MTDNPNVNKQETANPTGSNQGDANPTGNNQETKADHSIPYSVFKQQKDELNALKTQMSEFTGEQQKQKEAKMQEQGQLKELLQDKNSLIEKQESQLQEWAEYKTSKRDSLLKQIPEDDRVIYSDLALDKLEAHISKNSKIITPNTSKASNQRTQGGDFGGYESFEEWATKDPSGYKQGTDPRRNGGIKLGY